MFKAFSEFFSKKKIAVVQNFRALQVENFQYCGCFCVIWEFQDYSAFKCGSITEAFKMLLEGCSFFSKSFHVLQKLIKKKRKIIGMLQSLLIRRVLFSMSWMPFIWLLCLPRKAEIYWCRITVPDKVALGGPAVNCYHLYGESMMCKY